MAERDNYYDILERTQKGSGDITEWLVWFVGRIAGSVEGAEEFLQPTLKKAAFWRRHGQAKLNERQRKVINRMLDAGEGGFEGGMKTRKYAGMAKVSRATAQRELADLVKKGILKPNGGGGRSTSYDLAWEEL